MATGSGRVTYDGTSGDASIRALVRVVFEKELILLRRYWFNTASGLASTYIMFLFVFLGGKAAVPTIIEGNLSALIVGFFVWSMSWGSFQSTAMGLTREAQWGTLEQLYMTPLGLIRVLVVRLHVSLLFTLLTGGIMLLSMMLTTGQFLHVDLLTLVPVAFLTMSSAAGLGFAFGGLALVYKRISNVFLIVQFLLLGAITAPGDSLAFDLLPLSHGTDLLNRAMSKGIGLLEFPLSELGLLLGVALAYVGLGLLAFRFAVSVARKRGIMGHY